ncbi:uncharacterized protein LOC115973006 [Quercus lobata]|uniref:uncharacterized protein LOC115973006 n=1 Tax=Quercus lobata TaxID=97700 RepID=UPI001243F1BD|nr:uncharacterized protein LOC115973006 [Quercus lobata]
MRTRIWIKIKADYLPQCLKESHCFGFNGEANRDDSSSKHEIFLITPNLCDLSLHICLCFLICLDLAAAFYCWSLFLISKYLEDYLPLCLEESHCFGLIEWEIER